MSEWVISKLYKLCNALTVSWNLIKIILSNECHKKIFRIYATKTQMQQNIYVHVHCILKKKSWKPNICIKCIFVWAR